VSSLWAEKSYRESWLLGCNRSDSWHYRTDADNKWPNRSCGPKGDMKCTKICSRSAAARWFARTSAATLRTLCACPWLICTQTGAKHSPHAGTCTHAYARTRGRARARAHARMCTHGRERVHTRARPRVRIRVCMWRVLRTHPCSGEPQVCAWRPQLYILQDSNHHY